MVRRLSPLLALLLVVIVASPAAALTIKREWRASIGGGGHATLDAWTNGTGHAVRHGCRPEEDDLVPHHPAPGLVCQPEDGAREARRGHDERLGRRVGDEDDQQQPDGLGLVGPERHDHRPLHRGQLGQVAPFGYIHATKVKIPDYGINLAVVKGPNGYPYCGVAMYMRNLYQPGEPGITYIYAHARKGMFLPLLNASKHNNGAGMIGKLVYVYTAKSIRYTYRITRVRRHVRDISNALKVTSERLWLQTSEGPNSSYPKLIVVAERIATTTVTYDAAHPKAHPRRC